MEKRIKEFYEALEEFFDWAGEEEKSMKEKSNYHGEEAWEYAKLNIEGTEKVKIGDIRGGVVFEDQFLGRPYYITRYWIGEEKQAKYGCVCEYKNHVFGPVNLEELLPECFRFSPDGVFKLPRE